MAKKRWIGIDVGGANIKVADSEGWSASRKFPMWKHPDQLTATLVDMLPATDSNCRFALTMTGELADCFSTRDEGVRSIIDSSASAFETAGSIVVYSLDSEMLCGSEAKARPDDVAAANWHCLASYASRFLAAEQSGLLIDVGSTTTDIIPIDAHGVVSPSRSDLDRLRHGELLYFGASRTPLCAVTTSLPYRDELVPVMAELFATVDDCLLVLEQTTESSDDRDSANGQPRTIDHAISRIARMIGLDSRDFTRDDALAASHYVEAILETRIEASIERLGEEATAWILSGHGTSLVPKQETQIISLGEKLGQELSRVAPAYALACLAEERFA